MVKSKKTGKRAQKKTMTRRRKADNISRQTSEPLAGLEAPDRTAGKPPLMKKWKLWQFA